MLRTITAALALTLLPATAMADQKICIVDAEGALNATEEGKAAQGRLESMQTAKQADIQRQGAEFQKEVEDFQARASIMSDTMRAQTEEQLAQKQAQLQQMVMAAEQEMQQAYMQALAGLETKLLEVAASVAASNSCTMLLQKGAVVYSAPSVVDLTQPIVTAYDAKY